MKINQLIKNLNLKLLTNPDFDDRDITGCYIGDLLSWVMSKAQKDNIWITVQTNVNIVAVATLTEVSCIIIPEEIVVDEPTINKANLQDIIILSSSKNSYELACDYKSLL